MQLIPTPVKQVLFPQSSATIFFIISLQSDNFTLAHVLISGCPIYILWVKVL